MPDRLTGRTDDEIRSLLAGPASALSFNDSIALVEWGLLIIERAAATHVRGDANTRRAARRTVLRDLAVAHAALEEAAARFYSACSHLAVPDRR